MLHNERHKPPPPPFYRPKQRKTKFERLPWEVDVTLCIAAISIGSRIPARDLSFAMVMVTDERLQTYDAGGNFGEKESRSRTMITGMRYSQTG